MLPKQSSSPFMRALDEIDRQEYSGAIIASIDELWPNGVPLQGISVGQFADQLAVALAKNLRKKKPK